MGTILAPTYATLAMGYFEVYFYNICKFKWGKEFKNFSQKIGVAFLDDFQTPLDKKKVKPEEL